MQSFLLKNLRVTKIVFSIAFESYTIQMKQKGNANKITIMIRLKEKIAEMICKDQDLRIKLAAVLEKDQRHVYRMARSNDIRFTCIDVLKVISEEIDMPVSTLTREYDTAPQPYEEQIGRKR